MNERLNLNRCVSNILPDLQLMDFSRPSVAVETINNDVSVATEGRIQNFIQNLLPNTNFVLINAVFFKGLWQSQFEVEQTRTQEFLIPPGRSGGNVQMMSQSGRFNYGKFYLCIPSFLSLINPPHTHPPIPSTRIHIHTHTPKSTHPYPHTHPNPHLEIYFLY